MQQKKDYSVAINAWFEKLGSLVAGWRWFFIALALGVAIFAIVGLTRLKTNIAIDNFFLKDNPVMITKNKFEQIFGNNEFINVLIEADNIFSPDCLQLIRELGQDLKAHVPFAGQLLSVTDLTITSPKGVYIDMSALPVPTSQAAIDTMREHFDKSHMMRNRLYSADYKQSWIMLRLTAYPDKSDWHEKEEPGIYAGKIAWEIVQKYQNRGARLIASGMPPTLYRRQVELFQDTRMIIMLAAGIAILFLSFMLRNVRGVLAAVFVATFAILSLFGGMGWLGIASDVTFMLVPILLAIAVSIEYAIQLNNFFSKHFKKTGKRKESVAVAFRQSGWSVLFAALTTITGLLAFMTVPIQTVRWVGGAAGTSIALVYLFTMFFYPAVLAIGRDREPQADYQEHETGPATRIFDGLSDWIYKHGTVIGIALVVIVVLSIAGITRVHVDLNTRKMIGERLPHMKEQLYVAGSRLGMWSYYELALRFKDKQQALDPVVLKKVDTFIGEVNQLPLIKRTSSLLDTIKEAYQARNNYEPAYYSVPDNLSTVRGLLMLYERTAGSSLRMWVDKDYRTLRLLIEVSDYSSQEVNKQIDFIKAKIPTYFPQAEYPGFEYWLAGNSIQLAIMNQYVTTGLISSVGVAMLVIAILLIIVLGSFKLGLIAMIPNIVPLLITGGVMGFLGTPLEFVTMTIAPMVLGLTVDGTIYFTNRTRMEYLVTRDYYSAIRQTFRNLGVALFQTAAIICITFFAFLFARVNNMINMGLYTIIAIASALITNFFVTPMLMKLVRPFDRMTQESKV